MSLHIINWRLKVPKLLLDCNIISPIKVVSILDLDVAAKYQAYAAVSNKTFHSRLLYLLLLPNFILCILVTGTKESLDLCKNNILLWTFSGSAKQSAFIKYEYLINAVLSKLRISFRKRLILSLK